MANNNVFADMFTMQMNMMKNMTNAANSMANAAPMFGTTANNPFMPFMNAAFTNNPFMNAMNTGANASSSAANPMNQMFSLFDTWKNLYNSWASAMGKMPHMPMEGMLNMLPNTAASDAFNQMTTMASSYFKLFEFWAPLMQAIQEREFNEETFRAMFDPEQYNRILNSVFNYVSPEMMQQFTNQLTSLVSAYGESVQHGGADMSEMMQQSMQAMSLIQEGKTDEASKIYVEMASKAQKPFGPLLRMVFIGKDRTALELMQELLKHYVVFTAQYNKLQQSTSSVGQKALYEAMRHVTEMNKSGNPPKSFDEFFKMWVRTSEQAFDALFKTEEYGRLQGEMQTSSMKIREYSDKLMELAMSDIPVATRSELDEAYKSIQTLKRQVRSLERKVDEQSDVIAELNGGKANGKANGKTNGASASTASTASGAAPKATKTVKRREA